MRKNLIRERRLLEEVIQAAVEDLQRIDMQEVIICDGCKGLGYIEYVNTLQSPLYSFRKSTRIAEPIYKYLECNECYGHGELCKFCAHSEDHCVCGENVQ